MSASGPGGPPAGASSLRFGALARLAIAAALVAAVWLGVAWALGAWD